MSHVNHPGNFPLLDLSIKEMISRSANLFADNVAIISSFQGISKTFREINDDVHFLNEGLVSLGLEKGDRIGIWTPNCYEAYLTFLAAGSVGLVVVCLNPALQSPELLEALQRVKPKALLISRNLKLQNFHSIATTVMTELGKGNNDNNLKFIISCDKSHRDTTYFWDLLQQCSVSKSPLSISKDDACCILFTSGTTGKPKAIIHSHGSIINKGFPTGLRLGVEKGQRLCIPLPLFHLYGIHSGIITPLLFGATTVLPSYGYDASLFSHITQELRCTHVYLTPTMLHDLVDSEATFPLLKGIVSAGSHCPEHIWERATSLWPAVQLSTLYGTTETATVFCCKPEDTAETALTTVGFPLDHTEVKIVDEIGQTVPQGKKGELWVKIKDKSGQGFDNSVDSDGWVQTGDIFQLRKDGYGRFIGRKENMIDRGSEKISPLEIEIFLKQIPLVSDALVFGVPDSRLGEEVAACILVKNEIFEDQKDLDEEIKRQCRGRLAHFKIPRYLSVLTQFPTTALGKLDRPKMRSSIMQTHGLTGL